MTANRYRELYRIPSQGKIAGVCAGIADYFGMETWLVRILVVSGVLLGLQFFIVVYIAGWFILDKKPAKSDVFAHHTATNARKSGPTPKVDQDDESEDDRPIKVKAKVWQAGEPPRQAFHDIKLRYARMETQLRDLERYVTSPEFTVSREINRL